MNRVKSFGAVLAAFLVMGFADDAQSQTRPTLAGEATCIDAEGKYVITWTLTLALGAQEAASASTPVSDTDFFDGLDLIGQPQLENYPFSAEAGNIFTAGSGRLVNGPNVAQTTIDTRSYNPDRITAAGTVEVGGNLTEVEATVTRPAVCGA